jgi:phosphate transport system permease protein
MKISTDLLARRQAKKIYDLLIRNFFQLCAVLSGMALLVIIVFVVMRGIQPFLPNYTYGQQNVVDFLFGLTYRQDQQLYGIGFVVINTLLSAFMALLLAFPVAVLTALYIVKVAPKPLAKVLSQVVELLASIPSVVYGVFAAGVLTKLVSTLATQFNQQTAGGSSLLASILVLAIMIFPTITAVSMSAIKAVGKDLEWGSLALGATETQTQFKIVLRSAKSGIFAGAILGLGRAFGEATAVSMVAGNKMFGPTFNFFDITRTLTTTMLAGLKETTGLDYDIRFSIGIVLMVIILGSNFLLNYLKDRVWD